MFKHLPRELNAILVGSWFVSVMFVYTVGAILGLNGKALFLLMLLHTIDFYFISRLWFHYLLYLGRPYADKKK